MVQVVSNMSQNFGHEARVASTPSNTSNQTRAPVWKTVIKVVLIIVAIAAAIYVGKTWVIPTVAGWIAKVKAGIDTAETAIAKSITSYVGKTTAYTNAIGAITNGLTFTFGGAPRNKKFDWILKPIQAIGIVFSGLGSLNQIETTPFPAAGGGGHAW